MKKWYVVETKEDIEGSQLEEELNRLQEKGFNILTIIKRNYGILCIVSYKEGEEK